jgi:hypothetical protein
MSPASGRRRTDMSSTEQVKGPRSYFPSIEQRYGRPIEAWMALLATAGTTKHMELVTWLKAEHGMGHGHANALVAEHLRGGLAP